MYVTRRFVEFVSVVMLEERLRRKMSVERVVNCPDCNIAMAKGFVPDRAQGAVYQQRWYWGEATYGACWSLHFSDPDGTFLVTSYRCPRCGLLREYAFDLVR